VTIAGALRALRDDKAGRPSYRWMAKQVPICQTALARAANGRQQPRWEVVRLYVLACGGDVDHFERLYLSLYGSLR
jgi:hypothetical protein